MRRLGGSLMTIRPARGARVSGGCGRAVRRAPLFVLAVAVAALIAAPLAFENAGDPDSAVATWSYVAGNSGPITVKVTGQWSWGDNSIQGGGQDSQSCFPSNPVQGYNDVNGHWAVGIAGSWNDASTPFTLTGKETDGTAVTLHVGSTMDYLNPNYCAGTTAAAPYPSGTYVLTHGYSSFSTFIADTNGKVCVNAYDVHQPNNANESDPSKNGDNTLHNNHYQLDPNIDCSLATQTPSPDLRLTISPNSTNAVGSPHTFTLTVSADQTGSGTFTPVSGATVSTSLSSSNGATPAPIPSSCTTLANGQCQVIVNSTTAGVVTVNASTTVTVNGQPLTRTLGDGLSGDSPPATKTFVDAQISISPPSSTNAVGNAHTFTVTVKQNLGDGNGFVPLANATVTPTLTYGNGATAQSPTGSCGTAASPGQTDANGTCQIIVNSTTPGLVTINATTTATVAGQSITRSTGDNLSSDSPNATKTFVDAEIQIQPLSSTNVVNDMHTFTVTVLQNLGDGQGFVPYPDAQVLPTLAFSNGATSQLAGGTCTNQLTDVNGQCTITVNSTTGGQVTIHATTTVSVAGQSITRATGDGLSGDTPNAVKTYVDAQISITPVNVTNPAGTAHLFTVTVKQDLGDGNGFVPRSGASVTPSIQSSNGATGQIVTGPGTTCGVTPTDANGECAITVNSTTAGLVTVHATTTVSVGGKSIMRSTGDNLSGDSSDAVKNYVSADGRITISPLTATNQVGDAETFQVTVTQSTNGGTFSPAAGITVTPKLTYANGATSQAAGGSCTTGTTKADGTCTIVVDSTTAGQITVNATAAFNVTVSGTPIAFARSTGDGAPGDSADAVKTYVDAYITISPATADNPTGTTHVLTAQVFVNSGNGGGYVAAPNGTSVGFALLSGSVGSFVGGNGCTTVSGACSATITSSAGGTDTIQASTTLSGGGLSLTRTTGTAAPGHANSANAVKNWIPPSSPPPSSPPPPSPPPSSPPPTPTPTPAPVPTVTPTRIPTPAPVRAPLAPPSKPRIGIVKSPKSQTLTTTIIKTATSTTPHYGTAHFTIEVTNRGNVRLTDVTVTDALAADCSRLGSKNLGTLAPGASRTYSCSLGQVKRDFTNVAIASGKPPKGPRVTASDHAAVHVKFKTVASAPAKYTG